MNNPAQQPAIEIHSLSKQYRRDGRRTIQAVAGLDLAVPAGQVLGFLGPNGAGKTTTIKMICGLVTPTAGSIRLNGHDVARQRMAAMGQIGAVLEGTRNIYWQLSAWQNLLYFGRIKGRRRGLKEQASQLLGELGLWERRHDKTGEFSRGMQQKVAIACALIADPPILLLDEPTLGLDVQAARTIREWVQRLSGEQGKTIVLTTHQLDVAQELCQQVAIINHGRLITNRPVSELLGLFRQAFYEIRVAGPVPAGGPDWLPGFSLSQKDGESLLTGVIGQQDELYAILNRLQEAGLPLIEARRVEPNLEEVFLQLVEEK